MKEESRKIVIKLSVGRRQSRKALIWFIHHEITALKNCRHSAPYLPLPRWTLKDCYLYKGQEFPALHDMKDNPKTTEAENKGINFFSTSTHFQSLSLTEEDCLSGSDYETKLQVSSFKGEEPTENDFAPFHARPLAGAVSHRQNRYVNFQSANIPFFLTSNVLFARKKVAKKKEKSEQMVSVRPDQRIHRGAQMSPEGSWEFHPETEHLGPVAHWQRHLPPTFVSSHASALVNNPACDGSCAERTYKRDHLQLFALWSRLMHIKSHYLSLAKPPTRVHLIWWMCNFLCLHAVS